MTRAGRIWILGLVSLSLMACEGAPAESPAADKAGTTAEKPAEKAPEKKADPAGAKDTPAEKPAADAKAPEAAPADKDTAAAPGPLAVACPKVGYPCESGYDCTCSKNAADQIVRHEAKKKKGGEVRAVTTYTYDAGGLLTRSEEDGAIWDKKAKVDGKADTVWVYSYDADKNRTQHEVFDAAGKSDTVCKYKSCPPPYAPEVCYTGLKCK